MGSRADTEFDSDRIKEPSSETPEADESSETMGSKSRKSIYLILGGLVVTGIAAGWKWLRGLPK